MDYFCSIFICKFLYRQPIPGKIYSRKKQVIQMSMYFPDKKNMKSEVVLFEHIVHL